MNQEQIDFMIDIIKRYRTVFGKEDYDKLKEFIPFDRITSLHQKGTGKIIVKTKEDVEKVLQYLNQNEFFEMDYMTDNFVSTSTNLIYTGKFNPNLKNLFQFCDQNNIDVKIYSEPYEY